MKHILFLLCLCSLVSCEKDNDSNMSFKFNFDETQERLNNLGQVAAPVAGNATQTPDFKQLSVHLIELAPDQFTIPGQGAIAYKGVEKTVDGEVAIDFDQAIVSEENTVFHTVALKDLAPGTYEYIRVSVSYQLYDIVYNIKNIPVLGDFDGEKGTIASFLGFNTYIASVTPNQMETEVNASKKQGFWIFETQFASPYDIYNELLSGEAPQGATTVVNPLAGITDIPIGSCIITGKFAEPLVISRDEAEDMTIDLSFSINNSLEWVDLNGNGQLDFDLNSSSNAEHIVDMGLRGLVPTWAK